MRLGRAPNATRPFPDGRKGRVDSLVQLDLRARLNPRRRRDEMKVVLQLDLVFDAQDDEDARHLQTEIAEGEGRRGSSRELLAVDFCGHFPCRRLRYTVNGQITDELKGHLARRGQWRRQTLHGLGRELRRGETVGLQRVLPDIAVPASGVRAQARQIDREQRSGSNRLPVGSDGQFPADVGRRADGVAGKLPVGELFADTITGLIPGAGQHPGLSPRRQGRGGSDWGAGLHCCGGAYTGTLGGAHAGEGRSAGAQRQRETHCQQDDDSLPAGWFRMGIHSFPHETGHQEKDSILRSLSGYE